MKRILKSKILLVIVAVLLSSCYYDEVVVFEGLPENVSLKNDVQIIFDRDCNSSGCHDAQGTHEPSLVPENSYNSLTQGYVNTVEPEKSKLYVAVDVGGMPEGRTPLSENDKKIILAWITEGAKNN
ncbi:MAG TPA: hypothetical protein VFW78_03165 [Bacteroidia bacterium]|nr:hypothetical protein [Bacteroidia bacterium]